MVDDAIVVVENVERNIEEGLEPKAATRKAMDEVGGPVVAIAVVLSAVFIPTAFVSGITGPVLSPVCAHHRGLDADLRLQFSYTEPGVGSLAAAVKRGQARSTCSAS